MSADIRPGWAVFGVCWRRRSVAVVAVIVAVTFAVGASSALPAAEPLTRLGKGFVSAARNAIDAATMPQVVGSNLYLHLGIIAACGCQHLPDFDRTHITAVIFEHAFYRLGARSLFADCPPVSAHVAISRSTRPSTVINSVRTACRSSATVIQQRVQRKYLCCQPSWLPRSGR
jgi:hypothetical protein